MAKAKTTRKLERFLIEERYGRDDDPRYHVRKGRKPVIDLIRGINLSNTTVDTAEADWKIFHVGEEIPPNEWEEFFEKRRRK